MRFRRAACAAGLIGLLGCGGSQALVSMDPDHNGGIDPERLNDPLEREEAALRGNDAYDAQFRAAGEEFGVPPSLLKAVAWSNTRLENVQGEEEFEGRSQSLGVMGLPADSLEEAAAAAGVPLDQITTDAAANIRAAAALLAKEAEKHGIALGTEADAPTLAEWGVVLEKLANVADDEEARATFVRDSIIPALKLGLGALTDPIRTSGQALDAVEGYGTLRQELTAGPDYASAVWRPSPNTGARNRAVQMVIIHTCESSYAGCWSWLTQSRSGVSAHYVVSNDGREISQLVRENTRAFHIGATYNSGNNGGAAAGLNGVQSNHFTVGIEHGGFASTVNWNTGLLDASAKLTCSITKRHNVPRDRQHIVGHGQLQPANRTDPGRNWPWANYIARVNAACGAAAAPAPTPAPATPAPTPTPAPAPAPSTPNAGELVVDSNNTRNDMAKGYVKVSGNWTGTAATAGFHGTGYYYASTAEVSDGAEFWFFMPAAGTKSIDAWWTAGGNRTTNAPFIVYDAAGTRLATVKVNQQGGAGQWNSLGTFNFTAGWNRVALSRWTTRGGVVVADAVRVR